MKQEFFPKNKEGKYEGVTDSLYQSTFLPIFSKAEVEIKAMIVGSFWNFTNEKVLREKISRYIKEISKKIPKELKDRDAYIRGLTNKADKMIRIYRKKALAEFAVIGGIITAQMIKQGMKPIKIATPKQLNEIITKDNGHKINLNMWSEAKAAVRVQDYPKRINAYINKMTGEVITTQEPGKQPISIWQRAELDIRHDHQMSMIQEHIDNGEQYAYISSHPDCSKRCEKWQGKLVSLNEHATMSGFRVRKVGNEWAYSLPDIINQEQTMKNGNKYKNNILVGFNCRHYLIKYEPGRKPPTQYSEKDVKRMRAINEKCRQLERQIRDYKTKEKLYNEIGNLKEAKEFQKLAKQTTEYYKRYCDKNGFAWYEYRIKI